MSIVHVKDVKKVYGSGDIAVHALRGVSLDIPKGAFMGVAGPSGSGKSTLLNIISGLDHATGGVVKVDGKSLSSLSDKELTHLRLHSIGFIFQSYNLLPVLTAYENAEYILMLQGVPENIRRPKVMQVLKDVGLEGMEHRFPRELSGGQQQRVAIARAVASEPAIILADEPTANVDSKTAESLLDLMENLNKEKGITFVFSTHDRAVLDRSRELVMLRDGQIEYHGAPKDYRPN